MTMELPQRLLKILKNNPSWIGRVYESCIISAIKQFEQANPPLGKLNYSPTQRPSNYRSNVLFDPASEDNGENDVADIFLGYPQPVLDLYPNIHAPVAENKELFCQSFRNGWGVEVKSKQVPSTAQRLSLLARRAELKTQLPLAPKSAWMKTWDAQEYRCDHVTRRWADIYVYILYQLHDGYPDFDGINGCVILVIPTIILNRLLADHSSQAQTIQLDKLMSLLGPDYNQYLIFSVQAIARKALELANDHWKEMIAYKHQGDVLKRQWYEDTYLPSQAAIKKCKTQA
ncbi:hypothetical protein [Pseudomonas sp. PH1b]|uniref:hypothetical protein n=1 Tax=Pseudomonas sp. PH1b TaxID=1397282 RepID=UPI000A6531F0|nr:hypothetical protein [Pseudomonas sp. PH1b]